MTGIDSAIESLTASHSEDTRDELESKLAWLDLEILDLQAKRERIVNDIQKLHHEQSGNLKNCL